MTFFNHINGGGISAVHPPGNEPRDVRTGRLLKDFTAHQLDVIYEHSPHLSELGIVARDQYKHPEPELRGTWNGSPTVDISKKARDPARNVATAKPRHPSERAIAVAFHESFHAGAGLYYGLRVLSSTILPDGHADGCTMVQDVKSVAPTLHGLIMLAGQEGDAIGGFRLSWENYTTDNAEVGGSPEWREALRERLRSDLPKFVGGVNEIARQLLAKETLSEFQIKSAYLTGQRRGVAVQRSTTAPTPKTAGTNEKQPQRGRVLREFNMANPTDAADFAAMMGCRAGEEAIGYTGGYVVQGTYK